MTLKIFLPLFAIVLSLYGTTVFAEDCKPPAGSYQNSCGFYKDTQSHCAIIYCRVDPKTTSCDNPSPSSLLVACPLRNIINQRLVSNALNSDDLIRCCPNSSSVAHVIATAKECKSQQLENDNGVLHCQVSQNGKRG